MPEQVHDLSSHADVEGGNGLVEHQKLGAKSKGSSDIDSLALPPGKLMRISRQGRLVQTYLGQKLPEIFGRAVRTIVAVNAKGFGDDLGHRHARVEGREGILEYRLHPPAERPQPGAGSAADNFFASERDSSRRGWDEAQDHSGHGAFAGARFAYQPQGLASGDGERNPVNDALFLARTAPSAAPRVVLGELVYLEQSHGRMVAAARPVATRNLDA